MATNKLMEAAAEILAGSKKSASAMPMQKPEGAGVQDLGGPTPQDGKPMDNSNKIDATKGAKSATAPTTKPSAASSDTQNHPAGGTKTMREDEEQDEDQEQLDELSKDTLQSYHTKAIKRRDEHESGRDVKVYKVGANTKGLARAKNRGVGKGPYESIEHDGDQLDEVSLDTAAKVYKKRADNAMSGETKNKYPSQDVDQQVRSREIIGKRFGLKGKQMAKSIEKKYDNYSQ
jgi:hypothetical protein